MSVCICHCVQLYVLILGALLSAAVLKAVYVSMFLISFVTVCLYFVYFVYT
jgi:hypothetical protein